MLNAQPHLISIYSMLATLREESDFSETKLVNIKENKVLH